MEFKKVCLKRQSIRNFSSATVSQEQINNILQLIRTAPSAGNIQAFQIVVVFNKKIKSEIAREAWNQNFISQADIVMVFLACPERSAEHYGDRGRSLYCIQDATIACTYAMLAAEDEGLATTWVGAFDVGGVSKAISCKADEIPIAILPIGFSGERPQKTGRQLISKMFRVI
jgi:nitroreductase